MEIKTFDFGEFELIPDSSSSLQRTEEWLAKRSGCFTGSKISDLMKCGRVTSKQSWLENSNKVFDFGTPAEKYIYCVGKERLTGNRSMQVTAKQLSHGIKHEPLLIEQLLKDGIITDFEELGFEYFPNYTNGGASVDGVARAGVNLEKGLNIPPGEKIGLELKCCVSWEGHLKRMYEEVHEKHDDFWQFQSEMLATGQKKLLYIVTDPMTVKDYSIRVCEASEVHQQALLKRCLIADKAIEYWNKETYAQALARAICEFEDQGKQ